MRKLASVRRITELKPIEGADLICLAVVDGWQCIVKKDELKVGDLAVYFEIDSFLPERSEFEFLRKSSFKTFNGAGGFRIKTMKMKGQISQGLLLPLPALGMAGRAEGEDVTELLQIKKYEVEAQDPLAGRNTATSTRGVSTKNFPSFIRKTDQERIQNLFKKYKEKYAHTSFECTLKLDGSSMTAYYLKGHFGVCSRNFELAYKVFKYGLPWYKKLWLKLTGKWKQVATDVKSNVTSNAFLQTAKKLDLEELISEYCAASGRNLAFQGELMGPGIQKNREGFAEHMFFVFDVFDIDKQCYLPPTERREIVSEVGLAHVPVLTESCNPFLDFVSVDDFLAKAKRQSINHKIAEGIVYKSVQPVEGFNGSPITFKAINNDYLLKCEE